ncbi:hypothetical protein DIPPA_14234 [Diplonema papillatum]|nr:hypothetical protein DIPPA_14234 [Diplonema papillatum]
MFRSTRIARAVCPSLTMDCRLMGCAPFVTAYTTRTGKDKLPVLHKDASCEDIAPEYMHADSHYYQFVRMQAEVSRLQEE